VNIGWALSALLGLQLLMLLLWVVFTLYRPKGGGGTLGRTALAAVHGLGRRLSRRPESGVVLSASVGLLRRGGLGRWIASALTHGLWAMFCLGALIGAVFALSVRQYEFVWGTTLLTEGSFVALVAMLGAPAQWLGWPVPDAEVVRASRIGVEAAVGREPLVRAPACCRSLLFYGLLPRTAVDPLERNCWSRRAAQPAAAGHQPAGLCAAVGAPGSPRPVRSACWIHGRATSRRHCVRRCPEGRRPEPVHRRSPADRAWSSSGTASAWPPRLPGCGRGARSGVPMTARSATTCWLALRARDANRPVWCWCSCSLARTPDRGAERFLVAVREQARGAGMGPARRGPSSGGPRHRPTRKRVHHWQQAGARRAGLDYVLEVNLDDPRHAGCPRVGGIGRVRERLTA
jgi:hypothetical protein